ncbi:MAG: hypothetical protein WCD52_01295 [Xanthobacteraceae bacterium]
MPKSRKKSQRVLLLPSINQLRTRRRKLPAFPAIDLQALVGDAQGQGTDDEDKALLTNYRALCDEQASRLLRDLGLDPADSMAWQKGFYLLAFWDRGLGHVAWSPQRTNRNASRWTHTHNLSLLMEVAARTAAGLSQRKAVRQLARDPVKRKLFPYRPQRSGSEPKGSEQERYEGALWRQYQHLVTKQSEDWLDWLFGLSHRQGLSPLEQMLVDLNEAHRHTQLVKIK